MFDFSDKKSKTKRKQGFTLAELLMVVAILAILTAIAVPLLLGALDRAKRVVFDRNQSTIKSMGVALLPFGGMDFEENKVFYAYAWIRDGEIGTVAIAAEGDGDVTMYGADTYEKWAEWYGNWEYCLVIAKITVSDLSPAA